MKRKPINIVADIVNSLNGYQKELKFNINAMKERTNLHWNTSKEYLNLIYFIQNFAPEINKVNSEKNEFTISQYSKYFNHFELEEQIIVHLFLEKAFDKKTSINVVPIIEIQNDINQLGKSEFIRIFKINNNYNGYLNLKGRFKAQGIISRINKKMADFIENPNIVQINSIYQKIIKPFRYERKYEFFPNLEIDCSSEMSNYKKENSNKRMEELKITQSATAQA